MLTPRPRRWGALARDWEVRLNADGSFFLSVRGLGLCAHTGAVGAVMESTVMCSSLDCERAWRQSYPVCGRRCSSQLSRVRLLLLVLQVWRWRW